MEKIQQEKSTLQAKSDLGGQTVGRSLVSPAFQLKPDTAQEEEFPYDGLITGAWSAALRKTAKKDRQIPPLADVPKGEKVKVVGRSGFWLKVEWGGFTGYISQELVARTATPKEKPKEKKEDAKPKPKTAAAYQTSINEDLDVVTREEWGAREHIPHNPGVHNYEEYQGDLSDALHSIAIHHSGNSNKHEMSEVQDHHMDSPDYDLADVGYHYGINLKGEIVEGRPIGVKGSHISKGNTGVIGIVFLADLNEQWWDFDDAMSKKMEATLLSLIRTLQGNFKKIQFLGGHQEYNEGRSCPGNIPMAKMEGWRSAVGLKKPKLVTHK